MEIFTARPVNIIGNLALSSLYAGLPIGMATTICAVIFDNTIAGFSQISKGVVETVILLPVMCFICGIIMIAPMLFVLRYFGLGGPAFVYGICFLIACSFFGLSMQGGLYVMGVAMACSYVFCSRAYSWLDNPASGV